MKKLLLVLLVLVGKFSLAQNIQGGTAPTLTATPTDATYGNYGNSSPWFICWDDTYLYVGKTGGDAGQATFLFLDVDPIAATNGGVSAGSNTNGSLTTTTDYGVTATLPFRADIRIVITPSYLGYSTRNGTGGWNSEVNISSGNVGNGGGSPNRAARFPWNSGGILSGRPTAFNWVGYAAYSTGIYHEIPTGNGNPTGGGASPRFFNYQTVVSTDNGSSTNPFSSTFRSFETRSNYTYTSSNLTNPYDFTVGGGTLTFSNSTNVANNFCVYSGDVRSSGARTVTMNGTSQTFYVDAAGSASITGTDASSGNDLTLTINSGSTTTFTGTATDNSDHDRKFFSVNIGGTLILSRGILVRYGTFQVYNGVSGGTLQINNNGYVQTVPSSSILPNYGSAAPFGTLNYNGVTAYSSAGEWPSSNSPRNVGLDGSATVTLSAARTTNGTLNLASGTLTNGSNLTLGTGATISRNAGSLTAAPTFGTTVNVTYNNTGTITSGNELPTSASVLNDLTINNAAAVSLNANTTVNNGLKLDAGRVALNGKTITLNGNSHTRASGFIEGSNTSDLVINGNVGTLFFANSTDAKCGAANGTNAIRNITFGNGGQAILGNNLYLFGDLTYGNSSSFDTGDGLLILKSRSGGTASIAEITGTPTISGTVVTETFMNTSSRRWRFMTAPLTSSGGGIDATIQNNWQSASVFGCSGNYGTNIYGPTGPGNGLDDYTNNSSMRLWNNTTGAWSNIANTTGTGTLLFGSSSPSGTTPANNAFVLFVRGDKTVSAVPNGGTPQAFVSTTLAAKGKLQYGQKVFTFSNANAYHAVGNPYYSPVDLNNLTYSGIETFNKVYVWRAGSGSFGGWVALDNADSYLHADNLKYIQPTQAFMVKLSGGSGSVTFNENDKVTNHITANTGSGNGLIDFMYTTLKVVNNDGTKESLDFFKNGYGNGFNTDYVVNEDAVKLINQGENIFSVRNGQQLAIEYKPYVVSTDSILLNFINGRTGVNYELSFTPRNFDATVTEAKLVDKFLNTETPISLTANTDIPFTITTATGSNAADRFIIVFRGTGNLPNKSLNVSAVKQTASVQVNWEATYEVGVKQYELEFSPNGTNFTSINTQNAKNGAITHNYTFNHSNPVNGVNYYRIKVTNQNDVVSYSNIITINLKSPTTTPITVYPNPVKGQTIGLQLTGIDKGEYDLRLVNAAGQTVYTQSIQVQGSMSMQITTNKVLAKGNYTLQLINNKGTQYSQQVLVVE